MDTKNLHPGVVTAIIVVALALVGFFIWRGSSPRPYTGGPIDMGAAMQGGGGASPGAPGAAAPAGTGR